MLFDVGCKKNSYCSDMTRTFFYKSASEKGREVYEIVKKANLAAQAVMKPGMKFCEIDKVARDIITEAGYGPYFTPVSYTHLFHEDLAERGCKFFHGGGTYHADGTL